MTGTRFTKGHALGNDYIVIDSADLVEPLSPEQAIALCDRHRGAGSDGVLLGELDSQPVGLRIINPDGTEAEKSGNGLRIYAAYLHHRGVVAQGDWFDVRLMSDVVAMRVEHSERGVVTVRVRMGRARFDGEPGRRVELGAAHERPLDGGRLDLVADVDTLSIGNPHCVVFVDELARDDFLARAPRLCTHAAFPRGTNVQFARAAGPQRVEAWIWERGAGETTASGSSACAVASAAVRRGLVEPGAVTIDMPGGSLEITVSEEYDIEMVGPAELVYEAVTLPQWRG